jgi:hypothetical protein
MNPGSFAAIFTSNYRMISEGMGKDVEGSGLDLAITLKD